MATNLQEIIPAFFVGPNGAQLTPEQIAIRQQVAQSLLQQATDTSPNAGGVASILAKGVQGGIAGFKQNQAERAATENNEYNSGLLSSLFSGGGSAYPSSVAAGGSPTAPAATNVPSGAGVTGPGTVAPEVLKAKFIERGLPEHVADGLVMNYADESRLNPGINEAHPIVPNSRGGYGLAQWTGPRRKAYEAYAAERGKPLDDVDTQVDFTLAEFQGSERSAAEKILATKDAGSAGAAITKYYLRPAPEHRDRRIAKYTSGRRSAPVQTVSLDGGSGMEALPMTVTPNPKPTVAEALLRPTSPVVKPVSVPSVEGVGVANTPVGTGGAPVLDVTQVPELSAGAGLPFVGGGAGVKPAPTPVATSPVVSPVAQALAIRPEAAAGDAMVAGADQTLQPTQTELQSLGMSSAPAPQQAPQTGSINREAVVKAISDPRASPQTRAVAMGLLRQEQEREQSVATQQAEQEQWRQRQEYEQSVRQNDPLIQAQTDKARIEADALRNPQPKFQQLSPEEVKSLGLDPKKQYQQSADGRITAIGDSGVNVSVNTGQNTNDFIKKSDEKAAERFDGYIAGGRQAAQQASDMQQLVELGKQIKTGAGAQALIALGPYAEMAGIKLEGLGPAQAYKSIIDRLAPAMRVPGSGSSSDIDVKMFLNSLPNIGNSPEANAIINGTFQSVAQNKIAAADIAVRAQSGEMTWQEAEKQISALPNPYENFKKFKKDNPAMFGGDLSDEQPISGANDPLGIRGSR
ncbi:phage tail tip lysozyme [Phyllobacterium sp. SB3]|uniref:phage tail tip lysozyme n=1 Tax=Phyllobacterium sp. SB3 TaxID=3156073 RepID=UPI0032AEAB02